MKRNTEEAAAVLAGCALMVVGYLVIIGLIIAMVALAAKWVIG